MDTDILQYNIYIHFYENLYDTIYNCINENEFEKLSAKKKFKLFERSENKWTYVRDKALDMLDEFINEECSEEYMLSFGSLWQFCQFVRFIEKVNMFRNDPDSTLYVDSDMLELKERSFEIKFDSKTTFNFKLEKAEDKVNHQEFKVITLNVKRKYGKQMTNIFTIVNEDVKFNDSSDLYLIKTVNEVLYKDMLKILKESVTEIVDTLYRD